MNVEAVIINTHKDAQGLVVAPHYDSLRAAHPDLPTHIIDGEYGGRNKRELWKNSDRQLRKWWSQNAESVKGEIIAVIEGDTLVEVDFPGLPDGVDLAGGFLREPMTREQFNKRYRKNLGEKEWNERRKGPHQLDGKWCKLLSFGCYIMRRKVLDWVADPKWSSVFAEDLQNEKRFPTIAKVSGAVLGRVPLPDVLVGDVEVREDLSIYHGVPEKLPQPRKKG